MDDLLAEFYVYCTYIGKGANRRTIIPELFLDSASSVLGQTRVCAFQFRELQGSVILWQTEDYLVLTWVLDNGEEEEELHRQLKL